MVAKSTLMIAAFVVLASLDGCASKTTGVPQPELAPILRPDLAPSDINIPIEIKLLDLEKQANAMLPRVLYQDTSFTDNGGDGVRLKVTRLGSLFLSSEAGDLTAKLPIRIDIVGRYVQDLIVGSTTLQKGTSFEIDLAYKGKLSLGDNWQPIMRSSATYKWLSPPTLDFGPVKVPVTRFASKPLQTQLAALVEGIDKQLERNHMIKQQAEKLWGALQKPYLVNEANDVWVHVDPMEMRSTPVAVSNGVIRTQVGLRCHVVAQPGGATAAVAARPLPKVITTNMLPEEFVVNLKAIAPYSVLTNQIQSALGTAPMQFNEGKYEVKLSDVALLATGRQIAISALVDARALKGVGKNGIVGRVVLNGTPMYDPERRELRLTAVDFNIETRNALLKSANYLLHEGFRKRIEELTRFNIGTMLDETIAGINKAMAKVDVNGIAEVNGKLLGITGIDVYPTETGMVAVATAKGNVKLLVNPAGMGSFK